MPKAAVGQTGFDTGEVSPLFYGTVSNPRYKKGLETCLNYLPTLQGPLIRRPGTKYCGPVKDSTKPPILIPFKFSATQNYILEFGDYYIRFYANNGQIVTAGTLYAVSGASSIYVIGSTFYYFFNATRANNQQQQGEQAISATLIPPGTILELPTPYPVADLALLRYEQIGDTLYLVHPNYPPFKLQRFGQQEWRIQPVYLADGPYLPANSYATEGDNVSTILAPLSSMAQAPDIITGAKGISNATNSGGKIKITTGGAHGYVTGQSIFIEGVVGTTEANNRSAYPTRVVGTGTAYWVIDVTSSTEFTLRGSTFVNAYSAGGNAHPALFAASAQANFITLGSTPDANRLIALVVGSVRYWGLIGTVWDAATVQMIMGGTNITNYVPFPSTTQADAWYLGVWSGYKDATHAFAGTGYPACIAFHQDRLWFSGVPNYPQEVDSSNVGQYERFSPSDYTTLDVRDSDSCSFNLNSSDSNPLRWMKSTAQGLLAGTYSSEWAMTPSGNSEALTPTNFNAQETSFYGSANIDATKIGNAVMYIQRAARKLREMAYFFSAGTFRSSDLTEISEHITLPSVTKILVQKETQPLIWGIRSDGALVALLYNRDDLSLSVGWTRHFLGGQSDSAGTPPVVYDFAVITDPLVTFDQVWMVVKRWINGATAYTIEYFTKINDASILPEDSFQLDCGGTYDQPKTISGISIASTAVVTSTAHGFSNGNQVRIVSVTGLNKSTTDVNGNVTISNLVNEKTFVVAGVTANTFQLNDFDGNPVSSVGYSVYVSGGQVRKLVSTISGLSWLIGETVSVLTDGGIHPDCVVSGGGAIILDYPAAKVQVGYKFKSQGKLLRAEAGSAIGTSIGQTRRTTRAAIQMYRCGDMSIGTSFNNLIALNLAQADQNQADNAVPLYSGIIREGLESAYDFESQLCFQQSSPLPGTIQSISTFMEETDV